LGAAVPLHLKQIQTGWLWQTVDQCRQRGVGQGAENMQRTSRAGFPDWAVLGILDDESLEFLQRLLTGDQQLVWPRRQTRGKPGLAAILPFVNS